MIAGAFDLTLQDVLPHHYKTLYIPRLLEAGNRLHVEREQVAIAVLSKLLH